MKRDAGKFRKDILGKKLKKVGRQTDLSERARYVWETGSFSGLLEQMVREVVVAGMKQQEQQGPEMKGHA